MGGYNSANTLNYYFARTASGRIEKGTAYNCGPSSDTCNTSVFITQGLKSVTLGGNYSFYGTMTGYKYDGTSTTITLVLNTPYDITDFVCLRWYYNAGAGGRTLTFN